MIECNSPTIPTDKKYRKTQLSTVKTRMGKESVPFLGLKSGVHTVRFYNETGEATLTVKTWLSPYGWAWKILNTSNGCSGCSYGGLPKKKLCTGERR